MNKTRVAAVLAGAALGASALATGTALAGDPSKITIKDLAIQCYGAENFGETPVVDLAGTEIAKGFESDATCKTMRKLTKKTIDKAGKKGAKVKYSGFQCKAAKVKTLQPTGGRTKWLCEFIAADAPTELFVKFWQYAD